LLLGHGGGVGEVESQAARLHERPRLTSVLAEKLAERRVHDVGRRVGTGRRLAAVGVDLGMCPFPRPDLA
jgi:hypothetical protein